MDGKMRSAFLIGLLACALPAVGCKYLQKDNTTLPAATQQVSPLQAAGANTGTSWWNKKPAYGPPAEQVVMRDANAKKKEMSADTFSAFADAELEMAYDDSSRPDLDRDSLLDVSRRKFQEALKRDPKSKSALLGLGKLYTWAGDKDRALQIYQEALRVLPNDKDVTWAIVRCQVRFEDWNGALTACDMALAIDPENRTYQKAKGYCLARIDNWDKAFETLLNVMPESQARTFLGRTLVSVGRNAEAQQQLQMATKLDPGNEIARTVLSNIESGVAPEPLMQAGFESK